MSVLKKRGSGSLVGSLSEIWPDQRIGLFDIEQDRKKWINSPGQLVLAGFLPSFSQASY